METLDRWFFRRWDQALLVDAHSRNAVYRLGSALVYAAVFRRYSDGFLILIEACFVTCAIGGDGGTRLSHKCARRSHWSCGRNRFVFAAFRSSEGHNRASERQR